eukprot:scaffold7095_cov386-Prasinococcus_capsulatus_cf.AAC.8
MTARQEVMQIALPYQSIHRKQRVAPNIVTNEKGTGYGVVVIHALVKVLDAGKHEADEGRHRQGR